MTFIPSEQDSLEDQTKEALSKAKFYETKDGKINIGWPEDRHVYAEDDGVIYDC